MPSSTVLACLRDLVLLPADAVEAGIHAARSGNGYRTWRVPKGPGRWRTIDEPCPELKLLQDGVLREVLYRAPVSPFAHGFVPGRSIVTNAQVHLPAARAMVSLDLADAYPSVARVRARQVLEWGVGWHVKHTCPHLSKEARGELFDVIADVCCHRGCLPQGAPTSGVLLNLACALLDRLCARLVREKRPAMAQLRYSRYADDLTFTASVDFPKEFPDEVARIVRRAGFRINRRKVHRSTDRNADLVICGVRLHDGQLTLPRKVLRRYRALFFQALAYDPDDVPTKVRQHIRGALGFLTMVSPSCPAMLERPLEAMVRHHRSWLRPGRTDAVREAAPRYGH